MEKRELLKGEQYMEDLASGKIAPDLNKSPEQIISEAEQRICDDLDEMERRVPRRFANHNIIVD